MTSSQQLTKYLQHLTTPHCSDTTFKNDEAALVVPNKRYQGEKPSDDFLVMIRTICGR
jgi:hypothetical protein